MKQFDFSVIEYSVRLVQKNDKMHSDDKYPMDKWRCTIRGESFDYFTGLGHRKIPDNLSSFERKNLNSVIAQQRKTGGTAWHRAEIEKYKQPVAPDIKAVLHSLFLDADCAKMTHEDFCAELGYDRDSIKAHKIWLACVDTMQRLYKIFTYEERKAIREALQDY